MFQSLADFVEEIIERFQPRYLLIAGAGLALVALLGGAVFRLRSACLVGSRPTPNRISPNKSSRDTLGDVPVFCQANLSST